MLTADEAPPGAGAGEGVGVGADGDELSLPQASALSESTAAIVSLVGVMWSSEVGNRRTLWIIPRALAIASAVIGAAQLSTISDDCALSMSSSNESMEARRPAS